MTLTPSASFAISSTVSTTGSPIGLHLDGAELAAGASITRRMPARVYVLSVPTRTLRWARPPSSL
jgi:hypothetical protein